MNEDKVPWFPDEGSPELKAAVYSRRRELESKRAEEYEQIEKETWG